MAAPDRRFVWTQWEDSGFLERVNHSVTSCNEDGRRSMFAIAGFQGRGKPIEGRHGIGREQWNDLGDTALDILRLDVDSRRWTTMYPTTSDDCSTDVEHKYKPCGRYAHSCCWYKGKIYLYGGRNDVQFCDGVDCYDTNDRTWSQLKTFTDSCETPAGRYAHICTLNGPVMYVQGGTTLTKDYSWLMYTADVLSLNLETLVWKVKKPSHDLDLQVMPLARDFHSGVYIDASLIIFGGKCPVPHQDDNRFYKFSLTTHEWTILETSGYAPEGRRSLSAAKYGDSHIIYFGGFSTTQKKFLSDLFILNTESLYITKIVPYGMGPSPRRRAGMCLVGTELIICGGVGHKPVDDEIDNPVDRTTDDKKDKEDKNKTRQLMTFGDMYILHLVPCLQDLCIITADQFKLDLSLLPSAIRRTQTTMSLIYPDADSI